MFLCFVGCPINVALTLLSVLPTFVERVNAHIVPKPQSRIVVEDEHGALHGGTFFPEPRDGVIQGLQQFFTASSSTDLNIRNRDNLTRIANDFIRTLHSALFDLGSQSAERYATNLDTSDIADVILDMNRTLGWDKNGFHDEISNLFNIVTGQSLTCESCKLCRPSVQHSQAMLFLELSSLKTNRQFSVQSLLDTWFRGSLVTYSCEDCDHPIATQKLSICTCPEFLLLRITRQDIMNAQKGITKSVTISESLEIQTLGGESLILELHFIASMENGHWTCDYKDKDQWRHCNDLSDKKLMPITLDKKTKAHLAKHASLVVYRRTDTKGV
jgi:hypothetical protein